MSEDLLINSQKAGEAAIEGDPTENTPKALTVDGLEKVYGDGDSSVQAVDGISFDVEAGTVVGLLGPNGAGKTTTIKSLLGLVVPTKGTIRAHGVDVHEHSEQVYRRMGAMLEGARNTYWRLTVRENLRFFAALAGNKPDKLRDRHDELLAQFDLSEKADTPVRKLSRGQQQKVSLACTLAKGADIVFLDEPTLGLDIESSLELRKELRELVDDAGITVLLSSHDMDVIEELCDRVIIMNEGTIVADDTVENLLNILYTNSYEITVLDAIDADLRERLRTQFNATEFVERSDRTTFRVQVVNDQFYELIDTLRMADLSIDSFDTVEPDLEEVFLHVTDDTTQSGASARLQSAEVTADE